MADEQPATTDAAPAPPKKKGGLMKMLVVAIVLLGGAGGGAFWWMRGGTATAATEPELEERGILPFEPFLVNLTDDGNTRFLKATIQLVFESEQEAKHVEESPVVVGHLRSAILELLAEESAAALVTPDGKEALKKTIKEQTSKLVPHQKVMDVLFSEFVVQF